jgi:hypothetical protein
MNNLTEVLNVKILMILSKLCIGIGDTKFEQLMTLFSIDKGFYPGKTQTSSGFMAGFNTSGSTLWAKKPYPPSFL